LHSAHQQVRENQRKRISSLSSFSSSSSLGSPIQSSMELGYILQFALTNDGFVAKIVFLL
jgi:hypothetical protein